MKNLPASPTTYHVVSRTSGSNPYDYPATLLYDGEDSALAYQAYRDGIVVAKLAEASARATVTLYRQPPGGRMRIEECFGGAAWRAKAAELAAVRDSATSAAGQAVLGGAA